MDEIVCCMKWTSILWGRILGVFAKTNSNNNTVVELPEDIVMDILSRLPADLVFRSCRHPGYPILKVLTSSQSFIDLHLSRATSTIVVMKDVDHWVLPNRIWKGEIPLNFIDEQTSKKLILKTKSMHAEYHYQGKHIDESGLKLFDSYKGLLLFKRKAVFIIWNPITGEQVIVNTPVLSSTCGTFLDPETKELKIVIVKNFPGSGFYFVIYSLGSRSYSITSRLCHPPMAMPPVILKSVLYWLVHEELYKKASHNNIFLKSSESIVLLDMETETVSTMSRPEGEHINRQEFGQVCLSKLKQQLCYCGIATYTEIILWLLEEDNVWIKKHTVSLEFLGPRLTRNHIILCPFKIDKDDMLLISGEALYRYNLKLHTSRKIEMKSICTIGELYTFVVHTDSLVSLPTVAAACHVVSVVNN